MIKLSIVTLTYNNHNQLKKTLDSFKIFKNDFHNIELIIIDSSDKSIFLDNKILLFNLLGNNINYSQYYLNPIGIYNSMNYGLTKCKGDYLIFMNSSDSFYENFNIKRFFDLIDKNKEKNSSKYPFLIYGRSKINSSINPDLTYFNPPLNISPDKKISWNKFIPPMHQACFFNKEWHIKNFYPLNRGYRSDEIIKRKALISSLFIDEIICNYELSGISSLNNLKTSEIIINSIKTRSLNRFLINFAKIFFIRIFPKKWEYIRFYKTFILSKLLP